MVLADVVIENYLEAAWFLLDARAAVHALMLDPLPAGIRAITLELFEVECLPGYR